MTYITPPECVIGVYYGPTMQGDVLWMYFHMVSLFFISVSSPSPSLNFEDFALIDFEFSPLDPQRGQGLSVRKLQFVIVALSI